MPPREKASEQSGISLEGALAGMLALLIDERDDRTRNNEGAPKTEVILAGAGLSIEEIAKVTGKNYDAVRMAIARGKRAKTRA